MNWPGDDPIRYDYSLSPDAVLLDVGGYEGRWTAGMLARHGALITRAHVFEPVMAHAQAIQSRFAHDSRVTVHGYGLADTHHAAPMVLAGDGSSVYQTGGGGPVSEECATARVELRRAADVFAELGLREVAVAKINIEGVEYALLDHLIETGLIRTIEHLQVQFHSFVPDAAARMLAIQRALRASHEPLWQYPFVWESWRRTP